MTDTETLKNFILNILDDKKAENIISLSPNTNIASCIIIASGRSTRNIHAIAEYLSMQLKTELHEYVKIEGSSKTEWVLLEAAEILVHLFTPSSRAYYDLEQLHTPPSTTSLTKFNAL